MTWLGNGAGPHGPCPPCPQPAFGLWKNFSQRISLIREVRKWRSKEKQSTGQNNNCLVSKQSEGPLAPPRGLQIIFWATSCELSYRYWNPRQVEEVNYMMTRLYPWHKLPQFRELASRKSEQTDPGTEEQSRWCWSAHHMTKFKMTVRADCAVCACSPLPLSKEALVPWWSVGGVGLQTGVQHPQRPTPAVAGIQNKANFPVHQPCLFIGSWVASSWTPLLVTTIANKWSHFNRRMLVIF